MIRRALPAAVAGVALLALAAFLTVTFRAAILAPEKPRPGGQYTEAIIGRLGPLNPLFTDADDNAHDVVGLLYEPLIHLSAAGLAEGRLADGWDVSEDGRNYTFLLRADARWSDGTALTADDVLFTVRTIQDPEFPRGLLQASWKEVVPTALDTRRVRFALPGRNAGFLATVAQLRMIPAHVFAGLPVAIIESSTLTMHPVGSGPFRLIERLADGAILERNPFSWRRPWLARVIIRSFPNEDAALDALGRSQIDAVANLSPAGAARARQLKHVAVREADTYRYTQLLFNLKPEVQLFQDRRVRQAIAMAVDRQGIIRDILGGEARPADGPIPPAIAWARGSGIQAPTYDPDAAGRLLESAGWALTDQSRSRDGVPLKVQLVVGREQGAYEQVARKVATDLSRLGITVEVVPVSTANLVRDYLSPRSFQMALTALDNGPDPDVFAFWHSSQAKAGGFNFVSMRRNVFIDKDLEDGRATTDLTARAAAYADLQEIFAREVPAISLYSPTFVVAFDRRIRGVRLDSALDPVDRFDRVADWYVEVGR